MRHPLLLCAFWAAAAPSAAQSPAPAWAGEIGIQGGFVRIKPAGTGQADHIDFYDVPGTSDAIAAYGGLFAIVPLSSTLAFEPSLRFAQTTSNLFPYAIVLGTTAEVGLRADYAFTKAFYGAVGGVLSYAEASGVNELQPGAQLAVGYRRGIGRRLNGRIEAQWTTVAKSDQIGAHNDYAVLVGVSATVLPQGAASAPTSRAAGRGWRTAVGLQGGYARSHLVGGGDLTTISAPGTGTAGIGGVLSPSPAALFVIMPVGGPLALQVGLDAHQIQSSAITVFNAQVAPRVDVLLRGGLYAGAGGSLHILRDSQTKMNCVFASSTVLGYRFALSGNLGGRVEMSYLMYKQNVTLGFPAMNTFGLTFGASVALN